MAITGSSRGSVGGVCIGVGGSFVLSGGRISGNAATGNGGGVWITDADVNFDRFMIPWDAVGVVFENNRASAAYNRASVHDSIYDAYILGEVSWSAPFTQGYNNYDISYVYGAPIELVDVEFTGVVVESLPSKVVYVEGEVLDLTGLVVAATFSDGSTKQVTNYITTPANGAQLNNVGEQTVTVSYTEAGITKTTTFTIRSS